eukprot:TRINITY_DN774080_c0_g1_i1.p1 TRINITY_DN774080_c0_g1~~TRINITY_DN774080_c0_g1_i1.p1  ORF type:complete len:264 (+),score=69.74 TRINITY_DN774080_c0_g1_i1:32-823(+)
MSLPKLVVIGGSGFLGRKVCKESIRWGMGVTSVTRDGFCNYPSWWTAENWWVNATRWLAGDVHNMKTENWVDEGDIFQECDGVVFSAGFARETRADGYFSDLHHKAAMECAEEVHRAGVKNFVYTSCVGQLINKPSLVAAKRMAEKDLLALNESESDFNVTVLKPGPIFGFENPTILPLLSLCNLLGEKSVKFPSYLEHLAESTSVSAVATSAIRSVLDENWHGGLITAEDIRNDEHESQLWLEQLFLKLTGYSEGEWADNDQ